MYYGTKKGENAGNDDGPEAAEVLAERRTWQISQSPQYIGNPMTNYYKFAD